MQKIYTCIVMLLTVSCIYAYLAHSQIIYSQSPSQQSNTLLLKEGVKISLASYNADGYCTNDGKQTIEDKGEPTERWRGCPDGARVDWREAMRIHMAAGKRWDIVGLQEIAALTKPDSDVHYFTNFMKSDYDLTYNCVQVPNASGNGNAICSIYPILTETLRTINTDRLDRSYVDCVQVQTPAGVIVFWNAHPQYQQAVELFVKMESWIVEQVIPSYIPATIPDLQREAYRKSLMARTVLVGDMNAALSQITTAINSTLLATCSFESPNMYGIDHIMYFNMARTELSGGTPPFNTVFLQPSPNGCKSTSERWPTDHIGPVVAEFTTKRLELTPQGGLTTGNSGDFDSDGDVDIFDYNQLLSVFGKTGRYKFHPADIDGNGLVDIFDYNGMLKQFGK